MLDQPIHRGRRRNRPQRRAFVTTVAAAAAIATVVVATGCDDGTTNPPPPPRTDCPELAPSDGDDCSSFETDLACSYEAEPCVDDGAEATCGADGTWEVEIVFDNCNPPPPCPETLPNHGEECELGFGGPPENCEYTVTTSCGEVTVEPFCVSTDDDDDWAMYWQVEPPTCSGEPEACAEYDHPDLCAADDACRHLTPGCADEAQTAAPSGCFPAVDCTDDVDCADGESCTPVIYNPCPEMPGATCGACGGEAKICVATT